MSPLVAASCGEVSSTDAYHLSAGNQPPGSHSVRFRVALDYSGFGMLASRLLPPQQSTYAASLIRSDILGDNDRSLLDRHSCELTRL